MNDPEVMRSVVFDVIHNQIRDGIPPETRRTYGRLLADRYSEEEVMLCISWAVIAEMFSASKEGRTYDERTFVASLRALPRLPWDEGAIPR